MKLTDIVELAKQGYKPADIRELIAIAGEKETEETNTTANEPAGAGTEPEQTPTGADNGTVGNAQTDTADLHAEINRLKEQLKQAQNVNTTQTVQTDGPKSATDILAALMEDKNGYTEKEKR